MQALPPPPPAVVAPAPIAAQTAAQTAETAPAGRARVAAALTETRVHVDSSFTGESLVLYGAVFNPTDRPADVVVVVRGPDAPVRLVKKTRNLGVWLNSRPVVFQGAPGFYMTASTRPLEQVAPTAELARLGVGIDHLRIEAPEERRTVNMYGVRDVIVSGLGADYLAWRNAVVRLKTRARLYETRPDGVRFVDRGLFRTEVALPATAPTGRYQVQVLLFQDGAPVSTSYRTMTVEKVGFERAVYRLAHRHPWLYGALCVILAVATGYGASRIFARRWN